MLGASPAQNPALQKARDAFVHAQELERTLNDTPADQRSTADYLKIIKAYQRVYVITPHTGYADNALVTMARLYEEARDAKAAIRTLNYLIREYPETPFRDGAERDLLRLQGVPEKKLSSGTSVDNVRFWESGGGVRVVIDLSAEATFRQGEAKSPDRAFIDISPAKLNSGLIGKLMSVKSPVVQQIRVGQFDNSTVRVVLDLGSATRVSSTALHDPDRVIIDVVGIDPSATAPISTTTMPGPSEVKAAEKTPAKPAAAPSVSSPAATAPAATLTAEIGKAKATSLPKNSSTPRTPPPVAKAAPTKAAAQPTGSSKESAATPEPASTPPETAVAALTEPRITPAKPTSNGDRSMIRSLGLKLSKVVIDAGHGGHDTGTIGPTGYEEKDLVLDVAKRLKELVESQLGAEVVMTREDDTFVPLENRTALANSQSGDLFISIHANSSRVRTVRGVETFYLNLTTSRESLDTATRENAASERSIHELQDLIKAITLRDKVDESRELARFIQRSMSTRKNPGTDRGVKQAPFVVLMGANMPSILAEVSFISNPQEEKLLRTPEYRQHIAESLFSGVRSYAESLSGLKTSKIQAQNQE